MDVAIELAEHEHQAGALGIRGTDIILGLSTIPAMLEPQKKHTKASEMGPLVITWRRELRKKIAWRHCFEKKTFRNCQGTNELYLRMPAKEDLHFFLSFLPSFFLLNGKQLILRVKSNLNSRKGYLQFVFKKSLKPYLMPYKTDLEINKATLHVSIYFLQSKRGGRVCDILGSSGLEQPTHLYFRLL